MSHNAASFAYFPKPLIWARKSPKFEPCSSSKHSALVDKGTVVNSELKKGVFTFAIILSALPHVLYLRFFKFNTEIRTRCIKSRVYLCYNEWMNCVWSNTHVNQSTTTLKPLTAETNSIDHTPEKPWILTFTWMILDVNHSPRQPCRSSAPGTWWHWSPGSTTCYHSTKVWEQSENIIKNLKHPPGIKLSPI